MRNSLMSYVRSLMVVMALGGVLVLGACVVDMSISDDVAETSLESTASPAAQELSWSEGDGSETEAICPRRWTCDSSDFYSTQQACITATGCSSCYRDFDCNGNCICP
jgi:hypothetical protein